MLKQKKVPMRMCTGCREMKPKKELQRIVKSPEGVIAVDRNGRMPGRGAGGGGGGCAGGIVTAAMDGLKCAMAVCGK